MKLATFKDFTTITSTASLLVAQHGGRAKCLQRLVRMGLPVPRTVALSFEAVTGISAGRMPDVARLLSTFGTTPLVSVRPSSEDPDWGGPGAVLNIGMNNARHAAMIDSHGAAAANALYLRFIRTYAVQVAHLDDALFDPAADPSADSVATALRGFEAETEQPFPQNPEVQLAGVLRSMARAWFSTSARLLRQARGAPVEAGLGLVVQEMALGVGPDESGSGVMQFVNPQTGQPKITGRYLSQSQGRDALTDRAGAIYLTRDPRGPSLEQVCPEVFDQLVGYGDLCRQRLRDEMQLEFTIQAGQLSILDAVKVQRSAAASVRIVIALCQDGIISRTDALLRVAPRALSELLHPQVDPTVPGIIVTRAIAASPGAAVGTLVFSSTRAQAMAAHGETCILAKRETTPDDVRGMHAAAGILTERGGMSSHAAVIARGLGVPCVVGASELRIDRRAGTIESASGHIFREGDVITLDGSSGAVLAGAMPMLHPALDESFETFLSWADDVRDIGIRVNADTPEDAQIGHRFAADGIGLCRTEHMFFAEERLTVMREMIFADTPTDRDAALARLLPMQRTDFKRIFRIMAGKPVCIRLFDPPLHEFLPHDREGILELAEALSRPVSDVQRRIDALAEFNPMLGLRGVRLGLTLPEIYDMQARAIFEAALEVSEDGATVVPEIMIPLVSACREVEIVKGRIDAIAAAVQAERGAPVTYRLGVMVETPRAALIAGKLAAHCSFLSFGTNDLTQMTYGLSRDDAGRFMGSYVRQGVFSEDPFHVLDRDGVGELLLIGAQRGRSARPDLALSICGEHGGNSDSIAFCRDAGFDYVSCSPFRVPQARLATAQLALISAHRD
ncbi:putative PEP-binding protein [Pseudoruegeria sp. SK021]|uniref:putative PEP-binding protein n=1 Tax=Pseudoruegeria sp. SK021 TaxID=1933035 RepID=UPI000A216433|nr:putative PEP-binding protein [Pseudoruegeria sp. SK021]OSP56674.1 pyruvate, phosphate dikinase [Pseudoruegeria sp. SK021]